MTYLNVVEVESALAGLENRYPDLCERIELPNRTYEGRDVHALHIRGGSGPGYRKGVLFTACAHAREWGGAECAVNFAADLMEKYSDSAGLRYGGSEFSPDKIAEIVETMEVFVVPCVNPDGRHHSQVDEALWRKNRRPVGHDQVGVDINRNYDFLWNFAHTFAPAVQGAPSMPSEDPRSDTYHGTAPESEAETRNVVWLLDTYPQIRWLLDIHSYSGDVLYRWGDAPNQNTNPDMNFGNRTYNGRRGVEDARQYSEYLEPGDEQTARSAATAVCDAVRGVRGENYRPSQGFYLVPTGSSRSSYPTSGCLDDYAYSRHLANPYRSKVQSFTLEFGVGNDFHPPWDEMSRIVLDVCAGMIAFCLFSHEPVVVIGFDPHVEAPKAEEPIQILTGIIDGTPGWVLVGNKPVWVDPPDPRVRGMLAGIGLVILREVLFGPFHLDPAREALRGVAELAVEELEQLE